MCLISKNTNLALTIAAIIFALVAVIHVIRLVTHFGLIINGQEVPLLVNVIGLLLSGYMSYWLWMLKSVSK